MQFVSEEIEKLYKEALKKCHDVEIDSKYMNVSDILKAHYILADYFTDKSAYEETEYLGMSIGVRDYNLIASAVGRQVTGYGGKLKYENNLDICATLFFGLVKNHAFVDCNKRTALLVLLHQMYKYGYYIVGNFKKLEDLVVSTAENTTAENGIPSKYKNVYKKFRKQEDNSGYAVVKTLSYILRGLVTRKNHSFRMDINMKDFCQALTDIGVKCSLEGAKIKFYRTVRSWHKLSSEELAYTVNFYGWTRAVEAGMADEVFRRLEIFKEYPDFQSIMAKKGESIYTIIGDFEKPLRKLQDK